MSNQQSPRDHKGGIKTMSKDIIYKLKIVDPLDDPAYRYRITGDINWDEYWDEIGISSRVTMGCINTSGLPSQAPHVSVDASPTV